jgi:hypothetical protein
MREGETTRTTMASEGGGLIGAAGDGTVGAAHRHARVVEVDSLVVGGTLHGSGAPHTESETHLGSGSPTMPHLLLHGKDLDDAYPPLSVPKDEELPDLVRDEDDAVFQRGMEEARVITREARDQGRKRKMSPTAAPSGSEPTKETVKDEANFVGETNFEARTEDVATTRSPLGRRRSEKEGLRSPKDSHDDTPGRHLKGSRKENPLAENIADHSDTQCNDQEVYSSEPIIVSHFCCCRSDVCSCDLHRLAQALLPQRDHLGYDWQF